MTPATLLPPSGSLSIDRSKITAVEGTFYAFTLSAVGGNNWVSQNGRVDIVCETPWFFSPPPRDCPAETRSTSMVAQRFEHGLMLWMQSFWSGRATIIVLYESDYQPWGTYNDEWTAALPESDPTIIPPHGYYQPVRGFGLLWREGHDSLLNPMRERLGWALAPEVPLATGGYQCDQHSYTTCYLTGPDDHIYVLRPEHSGWYIWTGATPPPHY